MRSVAGAVAVCLTITACDVVAGAPCSPDGSSTTNAKYVLQCRAGKWVNVMTLAERDAIIAAKQRATHLAAMDKRALAIRGVGAWVDAYDWSPTFVKSRSSTAKPPFTLARIDAMAAAGVQTLYIQTAQSSLPDTILDKALLTTIVARARAKRMRVVGWYLPTFANPAADRAKLSAAAKFGFDGIGMDIESRVVTDVNARNAQLVAMSTWLRKAFPALPLAAIVLAPVHLDVINRTFWPNFPWSKINMSFDSWMTMGYWTDRTSSSGWRNGYKYTSENIDRLRLHLGLPKAAVHPVGGLANAATTADIAGYVKAAKERNAYGGSLYDDMISKPGQYAQLGPLRR